MVRKLKEFSGLVLGGRVRITREDNVIEGYAVDFDESGPSSSVAIMVFARRLFPAILRF